MKLRIMVAATLAGAAISGGVAAAAGAGTAAGLKADGLRWTAVADSYRARAGVHGTLLGRRADGLRLQALAERYAATEQTQSSRWRVTLPALGIFGLVVLALGVASHFTATRRAVRTLDPKGTRS
jgi:hypothetical protein